MGRIVELQHYWRKVRVEELGLLTDAADYYRELYRAALTARKTLLFTGWQFDSEVPLLRGGEALRAHGPVTLLRFLSHLCETRPGLQICILAWDYSLVFAAEREWMQEVVFHRATHQRLTFRFDPNHAELGSLHQKFVVVDDDIVFTGGLDVCDHRWDDRRHLWENPSRVSRGEAHPPYHDVQLVARSRELASTLKELFARRWEKAGGERLDRLCVDHRLPPSPYRPEAAVRLQARELAVSRTDPFSMPEGGRRASTEILRLYQRAIASAQELIYVETQYFSSRAILEALQERLIDARRPRLELVFILNQRGKTLREQAAVGLAQAQNLARLREVARDTGHALGLYYTLPRWEPPQAPPERGTYIHAKLMIVDDRLITVGSANLTNRSLGVDTELNVTAEAEGGDEALMRSIRAVRVELLEEHSGLGAAELSEPSGLVARLERALLPDGDGCRLRRHPSPTSGERLALQWVDPDRLPFDPTHTEVQHQGARPGLYQALSRAMRRLLSSPRAVRWGFEET